MSLKQLVVVGACASLATVAGTLSLVDHLRPHSTPIAVAPPAPDNVPDTTTPDRPHVHADDPAAAEAVRALGNRLGVTETRLSRIDERLSALQALLETGLDARAGHDAVPEEEDPELARELEEELEYGQLLSRIDTLEAEEVDPDWSAKAEDRLMRTLELGLNPDPTNPAAMEAAEALQGVNVTGNACFSTFCRLDVQLAEGQDSDAAIGNLLTYVPWDAQAFYKADTETGDIGSLYITRGPEMPTQE